MSVMEIIYEFPTIEQAEMAGKRQIGEWWNRLRNPNTSDEMRVFNIIAKRHRELFDHLNFNF